MIFSSQASASMEECAAAMGAGPRWFQLYRGTSDDLVESFVRRAEAAGCEAIVLTLDTTQLDWRPRVDRLSEFEERSVFYAAGPPEAHRCGASKGLPWSGVAPFFP